MTATSFYRSIGAQSGVQLNPIRDATDYPSLNLADQTFAGVGRFVRGRIDKSFVVTQGNQDRMLGNGGSLSVNALNEARVQIYEGLQYGATAVVVSRLVPATAVLQLMAVKAASSAASVLSVASAAPTGYLFTLKHLECAADGVTLEVHADEVLDANDDPQPSRNIRFRLRDRVSKQLLWAEFSGSLDPLAKDDSQNSAFISDIVSTTTDALEVKVAPNATVPVDAAFYGKDENGEEKWVSADLDYFSEGGTTYSMSDLDAACARLKRSTARYGAISACGSQNVQLITKLIALGYQVNCRVVWSVDGTLGPVAAQNFYNSVGGTDSLYSYCLWAPLLADDPLNGGKAFIGTEGVYLGLLCARNARMDANGIAPKNYPVAGKDFPIPRSGIVQKYDPDGPELSMLAETRINPVVFVDYATGGRYVFKDSLTGAKTNADRKLGAVADMATSVDNFVVRFAEECLQKPMDVAIRQMQDGLQTYFESIETAKWILPSKELGNRSFVAQITRNAQRPNDTMMVEYWNHYDGTNRVTHVQHNLSK